MVLMPGYKQTEVGVIPEDWTIRSVQDLIDNGSIVGHLDGNHGALYPRSEEFKPFGVPYITANDFGNYKVSFQNCKYLPEARAKRFRKGIAVNGDVLFAHNATVGPVALLETDLEYVILSTTATYYRCNSEKLSNSFVLYLLQSSLFVRQYSAVMSQSTRNQVPITAQRKLSVALPPTIAEQEAIAEALSDTDALIESLEQIITKKRQIKQGAMQELLTGKKRLPGFSEEWEVRQLDSVAEIRSGGTPSTNQPDFWDGEVLWCTPTDITALKGYKYLFQTSRTITVQGLKCSSAELIPADSVVMTSRATIGECAINVTPVSTNQGFKNFIPYKETDVNFLYYLLQTKKQDFISLCGGSTFLEIGKTQLATFEITLPKDKTEQTAIAIILSDMDAEITILETKLAKTRQLKQGMMHNLLTGRIRLLSEP